MTDTKHRAELRVYMTEGLSHVQRIPGGKHPDQHVFFADNPEKLREAALSALSQTTGDQLVPQLTPGELTTALHTLGEIAYQGLDTDLRGELSEMQLEVVDKLGRLWTELMYGDNDE
jgi:hypothetical protein